MRKILLFLVLTASAFAANPLPTARTPGGLGSWATIAGVPGGIPNRTTIFQTVAAGASLATVQAAVNSCPAGQVVMLPAGTYNWAGGTLLIRRDNVTVRGAGASTIINGSVEIGDSNLWFSLIFQPSFNPTAANVTNWTSGYAQGATSITVANATGYTVGKLIVLSQLNDADSSVSGNQQGNTNLANQNGGTEARQGEGRAQFQINKIAAVSGTTITLSEPLYMPNWSGSLSPQVWVFTAPPQTGSGLESVALNGNFRFHVAYGCWLKDSIITGAGAILHTGFIQILYSARCTIDHNIVKVSPVTYDDNYGIEGRQVSGLLVQNNLIQDIGPALHPTGCNGSVFAYNAIINARSGSNIMSLGLIQHGGFPSMNLYEGNYCPSIGIDNTWGGSAYIVAVRNRAIGQGLSANGSQTTTNVSAFVDSTFNRHASSIGNVLGTPGINTWYEDYAGDGNPDHSGGRIYYLGFWDIGSPTINADPLVRSTLIRAYNWQSANSSIVQDGFVAADIPNSYYLSAKPSWFGNRPWPWCDPDNFSQSDNVANLPAGYLYLNGVDPPTTIDTTPPALLSKTIGPSGTQLTLVFNEAVSIGLGGNGGWTINMSGTGTETLTYASGSGSNTLVFNISRVISAGETGTVSYTQPGNGVEDAAGNDLASLSNSAVNNQATGDTTAPTPNPSTFSIVPQATGPSTITMTATTSTDATGPVQYFFNETSGNAGGSDSGWQTSPTYVDTGLAAGTQYSYRVQTRDAAAVPNTTTFSASLSAITRLAAGARPATPFKMARANIVTP